MKKITITIITMMLLMCGIAYAGNLAQTPNFIETEDVRLSNTIAKYETQGYTFVSKTEYIATYKMLPTTTYHWGLVKINMQKRVSAIQVDYVEINAYVDCVMRHQAIVGYRVTSIETTEN